ncbi:MAG: hypothetical protein DMF56_02985 [Acidobacteria bacterium]|nr:MAG: hypothetical protein DMF56_02985 [Acidobacteriota bacterium]
MTDALHLAHAPIIEAVLDINCDLPPTIDFAALQERAKQALSASYPIARRQITQRHELRTAAAVGTADVAVREQVTGLQFLHTDEKQIVQFRSAGYTFNRLAPYSSLDDYLADIEWSWNIFRELTRPVQIRAIGLRFINRILLPMTGGGVDLSEYLRLSPQLADGKTLEFVGFMHQHVAVEVATENQVNVNLVTQLPENDQLPIILDIETSDQRNRLPEDWQGVREAIVSLRSLKNRVFERTLTEECLNLFR